MNGRQGGAVAGIARRELEKKSGQRVVSRDNYLNGPEKDKRKRITSK